MSKKEKIYVRVEQFRNYYFDDIVEKKFIYKLLYNHLKYHK